MAETHVRQEPLKDETKTKRRNGAPRAPLSREELDRAAPWIRLILGASLIAWSSYTTIQGVGRDFAPLLTGSVAGVSMVIVGGLLVAAFLSLGEWLTSEHAPLVYSALLIIDARYTEQQIGPWIGALASYHLADVSPFTTSVVSFVLSWGLSLAIARYGEILLFGRRR